MSFMPLNASRSPEVSEGMLLEIEERCRKALGDALGQHLSSGPTAPTDVPVILEHQRRLRYVSFMPLNASRSPESDRGDGVRNRGTLQESGG